MARRNVCDFCDEARFISAKLKIRGSRLSFVPGMVGAFRCKLELCDDCYKDMVDYIKRKRGESVGESES